MRWETGTDILKGVFKRLVFGLSESSKSKHVVKGEATVDVLYYGGQMLEPRQAG